MRKPRLAASDGQAYLRSPIPEITIYPKARTMTHHHLVRPAAPLFPNALGGLFRSFLAWKEDRATRKALDRLTDRELDDIGLARSDISRL